MAGLVAALNFTTPAGFPLRRSPKRLTIQQTWLPDVALGHLAGDLARLQQPPDRFVEADHSLVAVGDEIVVDALQLPAADRTGDRMSVPQYLQGQVPLRTAVDVRQ